MQQTPLTFGARLENLMRQWGMSAQRLAELLGYKSKTTILRILRVESVQGSREALFSRMQAVALLTEQERALLADALEVSRVGVQGAMARERLRNHLEKGAPEYDSACEQLRRMLEELEAACSARITLINCCWPSLLGYLRKMLKRRCAHSLCHYVAVGEDALRRMDVLCSVATIAHMSSYVAYAIDAHAATKERLTGLNVLSYTLTDRDGGQRHGMAVFSAPEWAEVFSLPAGYGLHEFFERATRCACSDLSPMVSSSDVGNDPHSYLRAVRFCTELERQSPILSVRQWLNINQIAPPVVRAALIDGGVARSFYGYDERDVLAMLEQFCYFQKMRYQGARQGEYVNREIYTMGALRAFALTGKITDAFSSMRPLSVAERCAVLEELAACCGEDGGTRVSIFKGEQRLRVEMICIPGKGVLALPTDHTRVSFLAAHANLIRHPALASTFEECFEDDLLRNYVLQPERSRTFLRGLIEELKRSE